MRKSSLVGPTAALLGLAAIAADTAPALANEPNHCRLLYSEQHKCGFGFDRCDQRVIERLKKECLLDDGGTITWPPDAN